MLQLQLALRESRSILSVQTTGNQTCPPGAPFCAPGAPFCALGVTFLCPGVTLRRVLCETDGRKKTAGVALWNIDLGANYNLRLYS